MGRRAACSVLFVLAIALTVPAVALASTADYSVAPAIMPSASFPQVVVADFDGDGRLDLATGGPQTAGSLWSWVALHRRIGTLAYEPEQRFETGSIAAGRGNWVSCHIFAVADLDRDTRPDIVVANRYVVGGEFLAANVAVLLAIPGSGFAPVATYAVNVDDAIRTIAVADLDGDTFPDLLVSAERVMSGYGPRLLVFWNDGYGTFTPGPIYEGGGDVATGDFDADGRIDFAAGAPGGWFENLGGRAFAIPVPLGASGTPIARDLDADGATDLVIAGSSATVFLQAPGGGFAAPVSYPYATTGPVLCADLDGNAAPDLVLATKTTCSVLLGDGSGSFSGQSLPVDGDWDEILSGDLDGDGAVEVTLRGARSFTLIEPFGTGTTYRVLGAFAPRFDPISATVHDIDDDGTPDLLAGVATGGLAILRGLPDGTLLARRDLDNGLDGVVTSGFEIERSLLGDFDGDGRTDVLLQEWSMLSILRGAPGPALFAAPVIYDHTNFVYGPPSDLALGDMDGDHDADLVMAVASNEVRVVPNSGGALQFGAAWHLLAGAAPTSVAAADFDGDGWCDVAANGWDRFVLLLRSLGPAGFAAPDYVDAGSAPKRVRAADLDGDLQPDLVVARAADVVVLWNADGTRFTAAEVVHPAAVSRITIGDVTGDGLPELFLVNGTSVQMLSNAGNRSLSAGASYAAAGSVTDVAIGDLDGDARPDLVVPYSTTTRGLLVLRNEGAASFTTRDDLALEYGGAPAALHDFDADGRTDLLLGTSLFLNRIPPVTPIAVEEVTAVVVVDGVRLEWRLSRDACRELVGVRVQRATAALGPFVERTPAPLEPEPTMSFSDPADGGAGAQMWYRLVLVARSGMESTTLPLAVWLGSQPPAATALGDVRPSAGDGQVTIRYALAPPGGEVHLAVFDVRGRRLREWAGAGVLPGEHLVTWDVRDGSGRALRRGVYLVRFEAQGITAAAKLVLARPGPR